VREGFGLLSAEGCEELASRFGMGMTHHDNRNGGQVCHGEGFDDGLVARVAQLLSRLVDGHPLKCIDLVIGFECAIEVLTAPVVDLLGVRTLPIFAPRQG
jgi:hypothetical protein